MANNERLLFICLQRHGDMGRGCKRRPIYSFFWCRNHQKFDISSSTGLRVSFGFGSWIVNILISGIYVIDCRTKIRWNISNSRWSFEVVFLAGSPAVILDCLSCLVVTFGWCIGTVRFLLKSFGNISQTEQDPEMFLLNRSSEFVIRYGTTWRWYIDDWCSKQRSSKTKSKQRSATFFCWNVRYLKWIALFLIRTNFLLKTSWKGQKITSRLIGDNSLKSCRIFCLEAKICVSCCSFPSPSC